MNIIKIITALSATIMLTACVSTSSVTANQINDGNLACESIATRIGEVQAAKSFARSKKGASGENIAAAVFFWPALITNSSNVNQMIESMESREAVLVGLYESKNCESEIPKFSNKEIQKKIKTKQTLESFE